MARKKQNKRVRSSVLTVTAVTEPWRGVPKGNYKSSLVHVFVHGEIVEPFTIVQPLPRKELALDLTVHEALGTTTACILIIEAGEGCAVTIDDLVNNTDVSKVIGVH